MPQLGLVYAYRQVIAIRHTNSVLPAVTRTGQIEVRQLVATDQSYRRTRLAVRYLVTFISFGRLSLPELTALPQHSLVYAYRQVMANKANQRRFASCLS